MAVIDRERLIRQADRHLGGGMTENVPQISIVVPAFSEEGNIAELYEQLTAAMAPLDVNWELIYVDDGSTDNTWAAISALYERDNRIKGLRLSRNFGHQYALLAGFRHARGDSVIAMDADLQQPPSLIPRLIDEWQKGSKIVHTVRIDHGEISALKKFTSRAFYKIFTLLSGVQLKEGMADFRLMDRQVVEDILQLRESGLFLRGLVHWVGYVSTSVEYSCRQRYSGATKYNLAKMLKFAWIGVTSFSLIPMRAATFLGLITSLVAFGFLAHAVWTKFFTESAVQGWATTISLISFLFGVLFVLLGVIGEYIGRILEEVQARPRFIISEQVGFLPEAQSSSKKRGADLELWPQVER